MLVSKLSFVALCLIPWFQLSSPAGVQPPQEAPATATGMTDGCTVNLDLPGQMSDIVSNALMRGLNQPEKLVRAYLDAHQDDFEHGQDLLEAAARHFEVPVDGLRAEVERFRHCNCDHEGGEKWLGPFEFTDFAQNVTLHVVLHELGHALVREFDLPVLGNEETLADAFATHYLTTHFPDRAVDVLEARTRSLMIEASEVPRDEWTVGGEHNSDARRAFQIAALAVAADPEKYRGVADIARMSDRDVIRAQDYGSEIHRSWRRTLAPLWMSPGTPSTETRVGFGDDRPLEQGVRDSGLDQIIREILSRFDWHSRVTVLFTRGDGGAGWSRSKRTVTVTRGYVDRFVEQGRR